MNINVNSLRAAAACSASFFAGVTLAAAIPILLHAKRKAATEAPAGDEPCMIGSWRLEDHFENNEYLLAIPDEMLGEHYTVLPDLYLEYVAEQKQQALAA